MLDALVTEDASGDAVAFVVNVGLKFLGKMVDG